MDFIVLQDIVIIFALSTLVNFAFNKLRIPTIIGYLVTGIVAGPHALGLIHAQHEIELMAEIGVVLLMFTIGLEFSLKHLLKIRKLVFLGGFLQMLLTTVFIFFVAKIYGLERNSAIFIGILSALSSTAVVLKLLQERSELSSYYGRTILGILIFQDIIIVPLILFTPILGGATTDINADLLSLLLKTIGMFGFVYIGHRWIIPRILHWIVMTRNQELFLMVVLLIGLSVALLTASIGMSLAFGAFLAGLMISESEYSHSAFGNLIPFKDTFTSFFFVSIGMLLDLNFVAENYQLVILTVCIVLLVKTIIGGGTAFLLGHPFKSIMIVGLAISQVGEFSFILAKIGMDYNLLGDYYYQLFLAVAIITMALAPFIIQATNVIITVLLKLPIPQKIIDGLYPLRNIEIPIISNHMVIIGKDARAQNLAFMTKYANLPYTAIVYDPEQVRRRQLKHERVIYGDATNESVLHEAHVETAEVVVISIGDLIATMNIIEKVRRLSKHSHIIVRSRNIADIEELYSLGANEVIPEEFETAINFFDRVLHKYLTPRQEIAQKIAQLRDDHYGIFREQDMKLLLGLHLDIPNIEVSAIRITEHSLANGRSAVDLKIRSHFGVTIVALMREKKITELPTIDYKLQAGDVVYVLGKPEQIANAIKLFTEEDSLVYENNKNQ